eukprot:567323-Rhodomonas_salina.1
MTALPCVPRHCATASNLPLPCTCTLLRQHSAPSSPSLSLLRNPCFLRTNGVSLSTTRKVALCETCDSGLMLPGRNCSAHSVHVLHRFKVSSPLGCSLTLKQQSEITESLGLSSSGKALADWATAIATSEVPVPSLRVEGRR